MLFSSWQFIFLFLPVCLAIFFLIPAERRAMRKVWLLVASLFFYGYWKVEYIPLLLVSIGSNYAIAEVISRRRGGRAARGAVVAGVTLNLLLLGFYKYTNFIIEALGRVTRHEMGRFDIILPLAISFFTFTQIGYLVDVFRDRRLHYGLLDYSLFVVFFPHLIAGPIVRHWEIIPQFADRDLKANRTDFGVGLAMFLLGLYKKVLLADPVSAYANAIFDASDAGGMLTCFDAWLGTVSYALQIYFDFSGYSDMAIGLSRMFGIRFPCNFDSPYRAGSIIEFWRRWHITLTRFLREYLYYPLGGNRCSRARHAMNVLLTMLVSGLWHGAGWTFVIWGGLHGVYLLVANAWRWLVKARGWKLAHWSYRGACVLLTFVMVLFAWAFFRAKTVASAGRVVASMAGRNGFTAPVSVGKPDTPAAQFQQTAGGRLAPGHVAIESYDRALQLVAALLLISWLLPNTQQLLRAHDPTIEPVGRPGLFQMPLNALSGLALGALLFAVLCSYYLATPSPFIYFNF